MTSLVDKLGIGLGMRLIMCMNDSIASYTQTRCHASIIYCDKNLWLGIYNIITTWWQNWLLYLLHMHTRVISMHTHVYTIYSHIVNPTGAELSICTTTERQCCLQTYINSAMMVANNKLNEELRSRLRDTSSAFNRTVNFVQNCKLINWKARLT